jgi:dihydrodipicolinate synthase/N-acetylneuraminate lyase
VSPARSLDDLSAPGDLAGVIPILVTPFTPDGGVSLEDLDRQLEFLIGAGVRWAGFGFGSEVHRLGEAELTSLITRAVATAGGRLGIIGNAELRSVTGAVEQVRRVQATGAQLAMVRPGGMDGVGQGDLFDAFTAVADQGGLPIIVQDAPQNTGVQLAPVTLARLLSEVPGVAALKIEPANPARKIELVAQQLGDAGGTIIGGAGGQEYLWELQRGAIGTMPGPAHPELFAAVGRLQAKGDRGPAHELMAQAMPLMALGKRDMDTFLFVQKYVLMKRGVLRNTGLGRPHRDLDPHLPSEIDELLDALALLDLFDRCRDAGL